MRRIEETDEYNNNIEQLLGKKRPKTQDKVTLKGANVVKWNSANMTVEANVISGWMRKTVQQVKLFQKTQFPLRYYICDKKKRRLIVYNEPDGKIKEEIEVS